MFDHLFDPLRRKLLGRRRGDHQGQKRRVAVESDVPSKTSGKPSEPPSRRRYERVPAKVPEDLRKQIDHWAKTWLKQFAHGLELRAADPGPFNYPIEVFSEWRGKAFYICTKYRARTRQPEDDFVSRRARMTMTGFGRFDLAFFRHTERWFTVHRGLTAAQCFKEIEANEVYWPTV